MPDDSDPGPDESGPESDLARAIRELPPHVVEGIKADVARWPAPAREQLPPVTRPTDAEDGTSQESPDQR
ncbi:hypothetical protein JNUCC0626_19935 [Lentzea sp. JNUCC 0626]|uniref:hypothetical protein n=1 Tax=Lentzea sp. JNUCC 0626 TaxID=3367513 RepID=UPI003748E5A2